MSDDGMLDTQTVLTRLDEFQKKLDQQAVDRHQVNNRVAGLIGSVLKETDDQTKTLVGVSSSLEELKGITIRLQEGISELQRWLKGEPAVEGTGVLHRLKKVEDSVDGLKVSQRVVVGVVVVLSAIGAVVTFVQSSGFIQYLSHSGK